MIYFFHILDKFFYLQFFSVCFPKKSGTATFASIPNAKTFPETKSIDCKLSANGLVVITC